MKLDRLYEYVTITIVTSFGVGLALYCGLLSGSAREQNLWMIVAGVIAITVALTCLSRIWILIPLCWTQGGLLGGVPVRGLAIAYVFFIFLALKALKVVKGKIACGWLDWLLFTNVIYIGLLFIRNPVGVAFFETEMVAGRPYLEVVFSLLAYWVLGHVTLTPEFSKKLPLIALAGDLFFGSLRFITFHFPATAPIISKFYTGISAETYNAQGQGDSDPEIQREQYLEPIGIGQIRLLGAYFPPITLINPLNMGRFLVFLISILFIFKSGHRIGLIDSVFFFALCSYFRNGFPDIIRTGFIMIPLMVCLVGFQGVLYELPIPAQRVMCFLPGNWDTRAKGDAEGSSEWRFEMWRRVWNSDKYIQNRYLGDGFGITKQQLSDSATAEIIRQEADAGRENLMLVGDFHSGPLSSVKFAGYIGSALLLVLLLGSAGYAWNLIKRAKGTPFFAAALFAGCASVYYPIAFIFIFGDYKRAIPDMAYAVAMLSMINRSMLAWRGKSDIQKQQTITTAHEFPYPCSKPENLGRVSFRENFII